eukprot:1432616-Amphidinium_carterae.1
MAPGPTHKTAQTATLSHLPGTAISGQLRGCISSSKELSAISGEKGPSLAPFLPCPPAEKQLLAVMLPHYSSTAQCAPEALLDSIAALPQEEEEYNKLST